MGKRKRVNKYFATYIGPRGFIRYSGVGKVTPGETYEVSEKVARALELSKRWKVRTKHVYEEINRGD